MNSVGTALMDAPAVGPLYFYPLEAMHLNLGLLTTNFEFRAKFHCCSLEVLFWDIRRINWLSVKPINVTLDTTAQ